MKKKSQIIFLSRTENVSCITSYINNQTLVVPFNYSIRDELDKKKSEIKVNPGTVKEVTVRTWMQYVVEVRQSWEKEMRKEAYRFITYDYRLELNNKDQIVGGEWLTEERPDFIWKQKKPEFRGFFKKRIGLK